MTENTRFHLMLLSESDEMINLWLPRIPEGIFYFKNDPAYRFLSIVAENGNWVAFCRKPSFFQNVPLSNSYAIPLSDSQDLTIDCGDKIYKLYVEVVSREAMSFQRYMVHSDTTIQIGNRQDSDVCLDYGDEPAQFARLIRRNRAWFVEDCGSPYGIYVNEKRVVRKQVQTGDVIYLLSLRIVIGPNCLSINHGSKSVKVNGERLDNISLIHGGYSHYYNQDVVCPSVRYFDRKPRKGPENFEHQIAIEAPPLSMERMQMPLMLRMGSSMVMGGAAALSGNFTTLISSVLFPLLSSKYSEKEQKEYEELRTKKYREYLAQKRTEIEQARTQERKTLNCQFPKVSDMVDPTYIDEHLWERRPGDEDFLKLRVGTGEQELSTSIEYPDRQFQLEKDDLEEEMYQLAEHSWNVENVPILLSLSQNFVCGLSGAKDTRIAYIKQLLLQIVSLHSYDEVKVVCLLSKDDLKKIDDIRYLPHVWENQKKIRLIATNEAESFKIGEYLKISVSKDKSGESDLGRLVKTRPFYIIIALEKSLLDGHEFYKDVIESEKGNGVAIIAAYEGLPKETQKIIHIDHQGNGLLISMGVNGGNDVQFQKDSIEEDTITEAFRHIANVHLKLAESIAPLPKMLTFLDMFGVGRVEQLNSLKRWEENNPVLSLATPVGVGGDSKPFVLDLHEKRQGPHGLVAGMTGSGKSEFIITYILSMAVNYHPDEVAFVLIDYKGGGLAGAFENPQTGLRLPHLVGTITNLDGASIERSLMSIESELIRRQRLFNEVKNSLNEGTMDIYAYQKLYREKKVTQPMPHLFIISDEFAELKQQQPEFMAKLISAARIGRSLGVHLILATQKPSGVVDDQIRSNTKFRVCLRVQDRSDSMDMLKRPEAAELTDTGRFYLQVGYNEYFAMGQSAWCGAPYEPRESLNVRTDDSIEIVDTIGQRIEILAPKRKKTEGTQKQLGEVVDYIAKIARTQGIKERTLWKPELESKIDAELFDLNADLPYSVTLGMIDDPEKQAQYPLSINLKSAPNILIVGNSGSGKTSIVQNMLYSLVRSQQSSELNYYILDYSSRMLNVFNGLPHCGAVLQEEDVTSLDEFFKLIQSIIVERKRIFSEIEVDNFDAAQKIRPMPLILIIIDNYTGMLGTKTGESHGYKFQSYLKNCTNYGVKYIVTCSHINELSERVRQEFGLRLSLRLKDKYEYSDFLNCKVSYIPPDKPGRGLICMDGRAIEYQAAILGVALGEKERIEYLKQTLSCLVLHHHSGEEARRLSVMALDAEYSQFARQFPKKRIPLAYHKKDGKPVALPLRQFSGLSIYLGNQRGHGTVTNNVLYAARREGMELYIVKRDGKASLIVIQK